MFDWDFDWKQIGYTPAEIKENTEKAVDKTLYANRYDLIDNIELSDLIHNDNFDDVWFGL